MVGGGIRTAGFFVEWLPVWEVRIFPSWFYPSSFWFRRDNSIINKWQAFSTPPGGFEETGTT